MTNPSNLTPIEESIAGASPQARQDALGALLSNVAADQQTQTTQQTQAMQAATQTAADAGPVKLDGSAKFKVIGAAFTYIDKDSNYLVAEQGATVLVASATGQRGVDLGVLEKA
ncbi:MAG: hypothetical protein M3Y35_01925 [Actinomycetota bacterium]|nr:hypothetical protein [Actinomycetota bacterium]